MTAQQGSTWRRRMMQLIFSASKDHAFLDRPFIGPLIAITPKPWRRELMAYLIQLSPHYFLPGWDAAFPKEWTRKQKLEAAAQGGRESRRRIVETLLKQYLKSDMHVLDFGCGPGAMAIAVAPYVAQVTAVDVSRGVIACARETHRKTGIKFLANRSEDLAIIPSASQDLVYSFAVLQHLRREQAEGFLREFFRVLKPGGRVVFQIMLRDAGETRPPPPSDEGWFDQRTMLRMVYYTREEMRAEVTAAGFVGMQVAELRDLLAQDHWSDQLVTALKPAVLPG